MAGGGGGDNSRELDQTPTWAVASVCALIIVISILLEKGLHHVGEWFTERRKKAMFEALEKIKTELMILGFISLLMTFGQNYIVKICIPKKFSETMLPCSLENTKTEESEDHHRRLLWDVSGEIYPMRRELSGDSTSYSCHEGKAPLISLNGLHQLHIFIFFLAVFHVAYSAVTMALGRAKIRAWKTWEREAATPDSDFSNDPLQFRFSHDTTFVRMHTSLVNKISVSLYFFSFFRQFYRSVRRADYLTMRHGFVTVHLAVGTKFNFQKYILRTLEDDFKVVVGISPTLWTSAVIFLLLNVKGLHTLFWISVIPLLIILAVGTKLQATITKMALEIKERHVVIQGIPLVQLSDDHFWFGRPQFLLFLIHLALFQNAFQIIYFLWISYEFGLDSCFNESTELVAIRICLGIGVQFLCSYVTLPLYALVSQMGSNMKTSIFDEQASKAVERRRSEAANKIAGAASTSSSTGGSQKARANPPPGAPSKSSGNSRNTPSRRHPKTEQGAHDVPAEVQLSAAVGAAAPADLRAGTSQQGMHVVDLQNDKEEDFKLIKLRGP